jgi:hypothetical protein
MIRTVNKTIAASLGGLLVLGCGFVHAADAPKQMPRVQHEMVPHVVLPETIQYKKTARPDASGERGSISPYIATYTPFPSYNVPYAAEFRSVGQSVYPVSPQLLPEPKKQTEQQQEESAPAPQLTMQMPAITENLNDNGRDVTLTNTDAPILLAADNEEIVPLLPEPDGVEQTGIFYQHPSKQPSAWSFSSPIFKIASVPAGWGSNTQGQIAQHGLKGCSQQVVFQPQPDSIVQPNGTAADQQTAAQQGSIPQGLPYSTFSFGCCGNQQQDTTPQTAVLPNGMVLVTLPHDHSRCGIFRCRDKSPRTLLLPPATAFGGAAPAAQLQTFAPAMPGMPFQSAGYNPMFANQYMPYEPQQQYMQFIPASAINSFINPVAGTLPLQNNIIQAQLTQAPQAAESQVGEKTAANKDTVSGGALAPVGDESGTKAASLTPNIAGVIATPYGYFAVAQQPQQGLPQPQVQNPYQGYYATPYGFVSLNQPQGFPQQGFAPQSFAPQGFAGYPPMPGMMPQQQGISSMELALILSQLNNQNQRKGLFSRVAERREERRKNRSGNDPFEQLCQSWATPYISPETSLRMPSRSAYPYGYFGAQPLPISTANYGGYNNKYFGNTTSPGMY